MKALSPDLNVNNEVQDVIDFISLKWSPIPGLKNIVQCIQKEAFRDGRALIDRYEFDVREREESRLKVLETIFEDDIERKQARYYDYACQLISHIGSCGSFFADAGNKIDGVSKYSTKMDSLTDRIVATHPGLAEAKPKGWDILGKNYEEHDRVEGFNLKSEEDQFNGSEAVTMRTPSLVELISLPHVMLFETSQGLKAHRTLVAAIYTHFLNIREFLNTSALNSEVKAIDITNDDLFSQVQVKPKSVFMMFAIDSFKYQSTQEQFDKAVTAEKEFKSLSEQERTKRSEGFLKSYVMETDWDQVDREHNEKVERDLVVLRDLFASKDRRLVSDGPEL